jgi:hypothetical protein
VLGPENGFETSFPVEGGSKLSRSPACSGGLGRDFRSFLNADSRLRFGPGHDSASEPALSEKWLGSSTDDGDALLLMFSISFWKTLIGLIGFFTFRGLFLICVRLSSLDGSATFAASNGPNKDVLLSIFPKGRCLLFLLSRLSSFAEAESDSVRQRFDLNEALAPFALLRLGRRISSSSGSSSSLSIWIRAIDDNRSDDNLRRFVRFQG